MREELPLVILTGHRKSGTSMFHRLFDGFEGMNLYPTDLSILYAYFPCYTRKEHLTDAELKTRLLHVLDQSLRYICKQNNKIAEDSNKFIGLIKGELSDIDLRDKGDVIYAISKAWSNCKGLTERKLPFVFKETSQAVFFKEYKRMFPKLKMISLVRDPRDNYAAIHAGVESYYSKLGEHSIDALSSHINRARMDLIAAKVNQESYPESFLAIRFEDLVNAPQKTMEKVCSFLGVSFDESMLVPEVAGVLYQGNNFDGNVFSGISNENIGAWKSRISEASAKVIEYWMADVMETWGYECEFQAVERQEEFSKFYEPYNCKYFYHDSFSS